jgi:hypothetical protein
LKKYFGKKKNKKEEGFMYKWIDICDEVGVGNGDRW